MTSDVLTRNPASPSVASWERLDVRLIPVNLSLLAAPSASFVGTLLINGRLGLQALITLGSILITFLAVTGFGLMRFLTTRYRLTDERIELRSGLLFRSERALSLDRVRSVDVTANPLHRVFRLTSVRIGTGEQITSSGRRLTLDGVGRARAAELRREILSRRNTTAGRPVTDDDGPIATMDWAWVRYGPLTIWGVGGLLAAIGTTYRTLHEMRVDPLRLGFVKDIERHYGSVPLWFGVPAALLAVVVVGAIGSTVALIEGWNGYCLERGAGGVISIHRGLLGTRSVTIDERRLSGVEHREPMLLRWAGGARENAVAGGLGDREENRRRRLLTPPMPRAEALAVAAAMFPEGESPLSMAGFRTHPRAALRRRITRGLALTAPVVAALAVLGWWLCTSFLYAAGICGLVLVPGAVALAFGAYRALGHGLHGRYLVTRAGVFARSTVALKRTDIVGWSISRSIFQRRAGLLTLGAATAAGENCYKVRDVAVSDGLAFAEEAVPDLLAPFLERRRSA
ncbi:PH domain-containing protein [Actinoallomurus sp. NBC_01490]|uniref:PH domain-containing protein n=1 Tax=Actinoallomurus sp. NBC_01490 TaxID=2903557 RepID=UPI002E30A8E1|nr:PH domain-containing protein [Actinoallomurus sp. NBC_01490]